MSVYPSSSGCVTTPVTRTTARLVDIFWPRTLYRIRHGRQQWSRNQPSFGWTHRPGTYAEMLACSLRCWSTSKCMPDSGRSYTGHEGRGEVAVGEDDLHARLTCLTPSPHMRCLGHTSLGRQEGHERPSLGVRHVSRACKSSSPTATSPLPSWPV